jgi:hypothetical protein
MSMDVQWGPGLLGCGPSMPRRAWDTRLSAAAMAQLSHFNPDFGEGKGTGEAGQALETVTVRSALRRDDVDRHCYGGCCDWE